MSSQKSIEESERLKTLRRYQVLDSIEESNYDDITEMASAICDAPVALITLVDSERVWFKSHFGMGMREIPREGSFCSQVACDREFLYVPNASIDPRFANHPLVTGAPFIRFYAGAPLISTSSGAVVGSLCVIDQQSRTLSERQKKALTTLARQIVAMFELRISRSNLEIANNHRSLVLNNVRHAVIVTNAQGFISDFNSTAEKMLQYQSSDVVGENSLLDLFSNTNSNFKSMLLQSFKDGETCEWNFIKKDGSSLPASVFMNEIQTPDGHTDYVFQVYDLSENKELQERIHKQSIHMMNTAKMASLGEMAAGIAHEINNPLAIIRGKVDKIIRLTKKSPDLSSPLNSEILTDLEKMNETTVRIANIIRGLQSFSRSGSKDAFQPASYELIITDTVALCAEKFKNHGVKLDINIKKPIVQNVECRRVQISQVVLNLLNNAFDAATENFEKWVSLETEIKDSNLLITISDSGKGIPPEIAEKLMQPFFTTKQVGKGTGLGLSISKGIVDDHGGSLYLDNSETHTKFVLSLPLAQTKTQAKTQTA